MGSAATSPAKLGLRERKKQQTRDTIARVALELFAERGYDKTTCRRPERECVVKGTRAAWRSREDPAQTRCKAIPGR
jgi:hypothetical protein